MSFDESKHPRDSDGKFTDGNGAGAKVKPYDSRDKFGNIVRSLPQKVRDALDKNVKTLEQEQRKEVAKEPVTVVKAKDVALTKSQWARYYKTLGFEYGVISNSSQTIQYAKHYPLTDSAFLLQKKGVKHEIISEQRAVGVFLFADRF